MNFTPIIEADLIIQIHIASAVGALLLGAWVLWRRKGTAKHKFYGRFWVALMLVTAFSSFFINELRTWGPFSPIHLISMYVVFGLAHSIYAARNGKIVTHKRTMQGMYLGGLIVAGALSFMPGRIMGRVIFENSQYGLFTITEVIMITLLGFGASFALVSWKAIKKKVFRQ